MRFVEDWEAFALVGFELALSLGDPGLAIVECVKGTVPVAESGLKLATGKAPGEAAEDGAAPD